MAFVGKGGISARILAHSIAPWGKEIVTFELEYPRFIHAEVMTHRLFSRNSASSRAIPVKKIIDLLTTNPATPIFWGKNQTGMQAMEETASLVDVGGKKVPREEAWRLASEAAINIAKGMSEASYHKQIVNRLVEPFQMIKVVITATELANFFHLRDHEAAQPEIAELARVMRKVLTKSQPVSRKRGSEDIRDEYHLPYISDEERKKYEIEELTQISSARCAAVSYRNEDYSLEKSKQVYARLIEGEQKHSSALEHVARVMLSEEGVGSYEKGVSHIDVHGGLWSGNFKGWVQHRKTVDGEAKWDP